MIGIIGGTGLTTLPGFETNSSDWLNTPYGEPSSAISIGTLTGQKLAFLSRHGNPHSIPPHLINYRANIAALKQIGVTRLIAVNAVGGIHAKLGPAEVSIPDQIIDYTYGREHTLYDAQAEALEHIDFTHPYSEELRQQLCQCARTENVHFLDGGVYAATQGPRLESAAEIQRIKRDGGDMVGMTGMPEAALARELDIQYASIALSVNWCAGLTESLITMEDIRLALEAGMNKITLILQRFISDY